MPKRKITGRIVIFVIVVAAGVLTFLEKPTIASHLNPCFREGIDRHCLSTKVTTLVHSYSPEEIISVTTQPEHHSLYSYCHEIAHVVGEALVEEYGPQAIQQCSNLCRSGCTHGAVKKTIEIELGTTVYEEDVHTVEALRSIARRYCSESDYTCHGVGHIALQLSSSVDEALALCTSVAADPYHEFCYQGVFMEILMQPNTPHIGVYPCLSLPEQYSHACSRYLPRYFELTAASTENALTDFCTSLTGRRRSDCILSYGYYSGPHRLVQSDTEIVCSNFSAGEDRSACLLGVVERAVDNNQLRQAFSVCSYQHELTVFCVEATLQFADNRAIDASKADHACAEHLDSVLCTSLRKALIMETAAHSIPRYLFGLYGNPTRGDKKSYSGQYAQNRNIH